MSNIIDDLKKTKIICTIGPASNNRKVIEDLINSGMNIARLNFSHGSPDSHKKTIELIREIAKKFNANISILQDLPGPKIRIGNLEKESYQLNKGDKVFLVKEDVVGTDKEFSCSHKEVVDLLKKDDIIFINDGIIKLIVADKFNDRLVLEVLNPGLIRSHKGMNIPSKNLDISAITDEDIEFIKFGIEMDVDFIAASFIRKKEDILKVKETIEPTGKNIKVIAKIENPEALDNIDDILKVAHGIMIARGDLGIEIPIEEVALKQKYLINKARRVSKPSIVATQMLRSMVSDMSPTRAEVTDVTNAIFDGSDAVMLSEETAIGKNPVEACKMMTKICLRVEKEISTMLPFKSFEKDANMYPELALSFAAQDIAENLDIKAFVVLTRSGITAQLISSRKINKPILAFTTDDKVVKQLNLSWGVIPFYLEETHDKKILTKKVLDFIREMKFLPKDSLVLITCGTPNSLDISTNLLELQTI